MRAHTPCSDEMEAELMTLVQKPHMESLFSLHDRIRKRAYDTPLPSYDPNFHPASSYNNKQRRKGNGPDIRTIGLHKNSTEPLGITLKLINNKLVIARILHGGLIHRQGLLQVGDRIIEVGGEPVDNMSPADLQALLKDSSGSIVIRVEPGFKEAAGITDIYMKSHFEYDPKTDRLIPSQEAGLKFEKGDILRVLNQDDSFWWQAIKYGENQLAGLIPSRMLEERRKAFKTVDGRATVGCMGKKKPKRRVAYSSHHCGEFECYDMMLYEPVMMVEDFRYKTIVLIGAPNIGRRSIKTRLLAEEPDKYADVTAHTTRELKNDEEQNDFHFVSEQTMRQDIVLHKFIEFGKHRDHLYGVKKDSIQQVIDDGKICILDVQPQALKHLRTAQFCPLVIFIKAGSVDGVRRLHRSARVDSQGGFSGLDEKDFEACYLESCRIEDIYSHYFDAFIVNENIDIAYEEVQATIRLQFSGKQWVPSDWVM
jgi:guanylate kinase